MNKKRQTKFNKEKTIKCEEKKIQKIKKMYKKNSINSLKLNFRNLNSWKKYSFSCGFITNFRHFGNEETLKFSLIKRFASNSQDNNTKSNENGKRNGEQQGEGSILGSSLRHKDAQMIVKCKKNFLFFFLFNFYYSIKKKVQNYGFSIIGLAFILAFILSRFVKFSGTEKEESKEIKNEK